MAELREALEAEDTQFAADERWRRLLTMIEDAGDRVTGDQWAAMGRKCGYDPRGLGGFYRGGNASMRVESDGSRVLTDAGKRDLHKHGRLK